MAGQIDKHESRRIRAEIRRVLIDSWDPCGVKGNPQAIDEYDSYLGKLFELLTTGATDVQLSDYLRWVESDCMGLNDCGGKIMPTIAALRTIKLPE